MFDTSYLVREHESILEQPRLLDAVSCLRIVRRSVDLSRHLAQPIEHLLQLGMRLGTITHRRRLVELCEQQRIATDPLNGLQNMSDHN